LPAELGFRQGHRHGTKFLSCRRRSLFRARLHPGALVTFFKILDCSLGLRMMAGAR
jgi:hypothetical protein